MDAPGFYGGWRLAERSVRNAFRGRTDEARADLAGARAATGAESTQASAGMDATESIIEFTTCNWQRMFESRNAPGSSRTRSTTAQPRSRRHQRFWQRGSGQEFNSTVYKVRQAWAPSSRACAPIWRQLSRCWKAAGLCSSALIQAGPKRPCGEPLQHDDSAASARSGHARCGPHARGRGCARCGARVFRQSGR